MGASPLTSQRIYGLVSSCLCPDIENKTMNERVGAGSTLQITGVTVSTNPKAKKEYKFPAKNIDVQSQDSSLLLPQLPVPRIPQTTYDVRRHLVAVWNSSLVKHCVAHRRACTHTSCATVHQIRSHVSRELVVPVLLRREALEPTALHFSN